MKLLSILLLLVVFACLTASKTTLERKHSARDNLPGPDLEPLQVSYRGESLKKLSFGFESFLSSLLWVRLLQEAKTTPLPAQRLSWEFSEVDAVTTLDPNFDMAYNFGSLYISFFRRDKEGGKRILEKWTKKRPTYWKPHHMLGMHYFLELQDPASAAPHILKASQLAGAPEYVSSLGVGLLGQAGATRFALQSAIELFDAAPSDHAKSRLTARIRGLRWHLQKEAWETALTNYQKAYPGKKPHSLNDLVPFFKSGILRDVSSSHASGAISLELSGLLKETFSFRLGNTGKTIEPVNPEEAKRFENIGVYSQEDSP